MSRIIQGANVYYNMSAELVEENVFPTELLETVRTQFLRYKAKTGFVAIRSMTVATAAPIIPHLKSKMILITASATVEIIANLGFPSARMMEFISYHHSNTERDDRLRKHNRVGSISVRAEIGCIGDKYLVDDVI